MNILITGGAGFIGSTLADKLLNDGYNIFVVDNFNDNYDVGIKERNIKNSINNPNYKLYRLDICDKKNIAEIFAKNNITIVIHFAAKVNVRYSVNNPIKYVKNNIEGTVNILECMKDFGCKKIIFASSSSVYGNCSAEKFSESLNLTKPISPYAATKIACEQFLYTYSELYNIQAVCLRLFTVYGPRQRPDLAIHKFLNLMCQNKTLPVYGNGETIRDYTYIDDVIQGFCKAINYNSTKYEIFNIGNGSSVSLTKMIKTLEQVLNKKAKIEYLPFQQGDAKRIICDISKAKKILDYNPKTDFNNGIKKFVEWKFLNNQNL